MKGKESGEGNVEQDGLEKDSSVPHDLPTGEVIAGAGQKAARTSNGTAERANGAGGAWEC